MSPIQVSPNTYRIECSKAKSNAFFFFIFAFFQMSFNGRLGGGSNNNNNGSTSTSSAASTLSRSYTTTSSTAADFDDSFHALGEQLAAARSELNAKDRLLKRVRQQQERQLASLCAQIMSLECGIRRKDRELNMELQQRNRIIREQAAVIRFLAEQKSKSSVSRLRNEALAKIPQLVEEKGEGGKSNNVTTIKVNVADSEKNHLDAISEESSSVTTVKVVSSKNEDSDSAIIVDSERPNKVRSLRRTRRRLDSSSRRLSRSVSDVLSLLDEEEEVNSSSSSTASFSQDSAVANDSSRTSHSLSEPEDVDDDDDDYVDEDDDDDAAQDNYSGYLFRHGSFERFKSLDEITGE